MKLAKKEHPLAITRKKIGLSQKELAEKVFLTQHAISQYETGARTPGLEKAIAIARAVGSDVETLFDVKIEYEATS